MTCGDGRHCMMLSDNGVMVMITAAPEGHVSWREQAFPRTWPDMGVEVSYATGRGCFISAAFRERPGAASEATHDGARTWTPISLPAVNGDPIAIVYPISCPSPAGGGRDLRPDLARVVPSAWRCPDPSPSVTPPPENAYSAR